MKIFNATCASGVVLVGGLPVVNCPILGEGVGASSGYLIMAENKLVYLPKTTPDVKSFLTQTENLCGKLENLCDAIQAITVICSSPGSPSGTPINSAAFAITKMELIQIHSILTTLKNTLK